MAILKFSDFKTNRTSFKEAKTKEALFAKHTKLFNEKLKEFGVGSPAELSEGDQIKFYDSLKPVTEAAEKANASGKDVATLPKDGDEKIADTTKKEKQSLGDDKGGAKVVTETKVQKETAGESGQAVEDQPGDKIVQKYLDDDADGKIDKQPHDGGTPASKETVNASGKVLESDDAGSAKEVAKEPGTTKIDDKTSVQKEKAGESGQAVEDQEGAKVKVTLTDKDNKGILEAKEKAGDSGQALEDQPGAKIVKKYVDTDADGRLNLGGTLKEQIEATKAMLAELESVNEAKVESEADFKKYAKETLKKAHGDDYDEAKATKLIDGIAKEHGSDGKWGDAVGILNKSLD